ncbi:melanoma-derived growth regulatory protein isoform 2-T2 [Molossus nigricans]
MTWSRVFLSVIILLYAFPGPTVGGRPMPKLADRKLCADEECSRKRPYLHSCGPSGLCSSRLPFPDNTQGPSCVQGDYYGDMAARLGFFPSSIVREDQTLKPGKIDVKTDVSVLGAGRDLEGEDPWVMIVGKEASALGSQAA